MLLISPLLLLLCCPFYIAFTDTIRQGEQLGYFENQLHSKNGVFILRFFTFDTPQKTQSYLGLFYNKPQSHDGVAVWDSLSYDSYYLKTSSVRRQKAIWEEYGKKAIWVANRNNPITNIHPKLAIDEYGNLKISDYNGTDLFVLNSFEGAMLKKTYGESKINASATLLNDGNFVLREMNSDGSTKQVLWQSFDYPTDTLLPGMKLGMNFKTGRNWTLNSWIGDSNPSEGSFTLGVDPVNKNQLIIWWKDKIYWTSGPWENGRCEFSPRNAIVTTTHEGYYCTYSGFESHTFPNYRMELSGIVSQRTGNDVFGKPCYSSSNYVDGGCMKDNKIPQCRDNTTSHSRQYKYNDYRPYYMKYGDPFMSDKNHTLSLFDCWYKCWSICTCAAYASANDDETGCQLWSKEMKIDHPHEYAQTQDRQIYVLDEHVDVLPDPVQNDLSIILLIIVAAGVPVVIILCSAFQLIRKKHWFIGSIKAGFWALVLMVKNLGIGLVLVIKSYVAEIKRKRARSKRMFMSLEKLNKDGKKSPELRFFSFQTIAFGTNNFAATNKLGEGGFGPVYKGKLKDGLEIAVKRLSTNSGQGLAEFKNELTLIARVQHTNLVKLVGCCIQRKEMMLMYEYMSNKSLDFFLFDPSRRSLLDWKKRYNIIQGIAQGLLYLHKYSRLRMIHRDLKAGNILLDDDMNPKISDFGMARIFEQHESKANTNRIVGTYGYMSPEYAMEGLCSMKSDVFSFGVLLLEIISGTKNNSYNRPDHTLTLAGHAWDLWKEGKCMELMDPTLEDSYNDNEVLRCIHVGLLSVQDNPTDRPTMSDIAAMISYDSIPLSEPKQPAFCFSTRTPVSESVVEEKLEIVSNQVSITKMHPR